MKHSSLLDLKFKCSKNTAPSHSPYGGARKGHEYNDTKHSGKIDEGSPIRLTHRMGVEGNKKSSGIFELRT